MIHYRFGNATKVLLYEFDWGEVIGHETTNCTIPTYLRWCNHKFALEPCDQTILHFCHDTYPLYFSFLSLNLLWHVRRDSSIENQIPIGTQQDMQVGVKIHIMIDLIVVPFVTAPQTRHILKLSSQILVSRTTIRRIQSQRILCMDITFIVV